MGNQGTREITPNNTGCGKPNEERVKTFMTSEESEKQGKVNLEKGQKLPNFMKDGQRVPEIEVVKCLLPMEAEGKFAVILNNVFSRSECQEIIDWTEQNLEYTPAMLNIGRGMQILDLRARKHDRAIYDSKEFVHYMMERITDYIPSDFNCRKLSCLNERCRFLRYGAGNYFAPHYDGQYKRPDGSERSYLTILFYLNDNFEGGTTNFLGRRGDCLPVPFQTGSILVFEHDVYHEGARLMNGMKYLMRTDVMYLSARTDAKKKKIKGKKTELKGKQVPKVAETEITAPTHNPPTEIDIQEVLDLAEELDSIFH